MSAIIALNSLPSSFTDELKIPYRKYLRKGLIYSIIIHICVVAAYGGVHYYTKYKQEQELKTIQQRIINVSLTDLEPPPSALDEEVPPPKIEEITTPTKDLEALTPEPVAREKADVQTIKTQQQLEDIKTPVSNVGDTGKFSFSGPIKIEERKIEEKIIKKEVVEEKEKTVYQSFEVEKAPECVNLQQVRSSMVYPPMAIEAQIEGKVTVKVLVDGDGSVIKVGSVNGPDIFRDEVSSKSMQLQFTPGLQNGKPVKVWVTVPFVFKLK
ncbi:MAG TPA: TonB family protein [Ignavibacteria bacterium]|nr:TonB family protein [Ignavibacteria bacterium]HMQ99072.1 TonB family protein [Ignavibacteria bacterium]